MGIWFWCTDQTIVQRLLGGRDLKQAQLGAVLAGFLKVGTPIIFFLPGIFCRILHPNLSDPNEAYITMVTNYLPVGMVGLIIAVLMAALISTVDSGLNSISTVFTLDFYTRKFRPNATTKEVIWIGRVVTILAAFFSIFVALGYAAIKGMDLFSLGQSIFSFLAPPVAAIFLVGVLWRGANTKGAIITLIGGGIFNITLGIIFLAKLPSPEFWDKPLLHFLLLGFYLFVAEVILMIIISLITGKPAPEKQLPTVRETYKQLGHSSKLVWILWLVLALLMAFLYIFFQLANGSDLHGKKMRVYPGTVPIVDGILAEGEYDDATEIKGVIKWAAQFVVVKRP